mgnify:CR=1 FL=1
MKFIKKLLKKRKYKLKSKFYLEAAYLNKTDFKEGVGLSYNINNETGELTVVATDEKTRNHVASVTQTRTKKVVPTIDIRKSDVREFLKSASEFELSVYEDRIILSVVANEKSQLQEELLRDENNNVVELATYKNSKVKAFAISQSQFKSVVGEQISFEDLFTSSADEFLDKPKMEKKVISMVSLFSGAGILDSAFHNSGNYDIKFAIDIHDVPGRKKRLNGYHLDTYRKNIGDHIVDGDVMKLTKADIPKADFVIGGVPCVRFSKLNTKDNFRDSNEETYDLLERYLDVVEWSNAKAFVIENVKEFVRVNNGVMIKRIKERMSNFNIVYKIINAADLGSAQIRKRAIIFGMKKIMPKLEVPKVSIVRTVRDVFKGVENAPQYDKGFRPLKDEYLGYAKMIPPGRNASVIPDSMRPNRKYDNFMQRLHYDKQSPTITGTDSDYVLHPVLDRRLNVAELKRLFNISDDYELLGSMTSIATQLKNCVDYKVAEFLAKTVYEQMLPIL